MDLHPVPSWTLHAAAVTQLPASYAEDILSKTSCSIAPSGGDAFQLQLFASKVLNAAPHGGSPDPDQHNLRTAPSTIDAAFFTGGLTWQLDFLPPPPGPPADLRSLATTTDICAICVHPQGTTRNRAGQTLHGPGLIQIWAIPNTPASASCPDGSPTYLLGIAHAGRVTWDAKWCPDPTHLPHAHPLSFTALEPPPTATSPQVPTLGLLAAVLGDGSVQVLSVPRPTTSLIGTSEPVNGQLQLPPGSTCRVEPHVAVTHTQLAGSMASCVAWQSTAPHNHLIVGCWDGTAVLLKLPLGSRGTCQGLAHFKADEGIRTVAWTPPPASPSVDGLERHMVMTASTSGRVKLWDTRDLQQPLLEKLLYRCQIMEAGWAGGASGGVYCCMEDGIMRVLPLDTRFQAVVKDCSSSFKGEGMGCLWCVGICNEAGVAAVAGEDGVVGLVHVENIPDTRRRKPHIPIGGFEACGPVLHLIDPRVQSADNWGLFSGGTWFAGYKDTRKHAKTPAWPEDAQTVYCVRFGGVCEGSAWVAYGGAAGVVRVQRVALGSAHGSS